jgi:hypothetical protein
MTGELPLREELRGRTLYGAPQIDVPVRLNNNENSYPVPDAVVDTMAKRCTPSCVTSTGTPWRCARTSPPTLGTS